MYTDLRQWIWIRKRILEEGASRRQIARELLIARKTVAKITRHRVPPGYRRSQPYRRPVIGPHVREIHALLDQNEILPQHAQLTVKDMFTKLRADYGYKGSYTALYKYIRQHSVPPAQPVDVWDDVYDILTSLPKQRAIALLRLVSRSDTPVVSERKAKELVSRCQGIFESKLSQKPDHRKLKKKAAANWMQAVIQKSKSQNEIELDVGNILEFEKLLGQVYGGSLAQRNKAMSVLASAHGISARTICQSLDISRNAARRYLRDFRIGGVKRLNARQRSVPWKRDDESIKKAVLSTLHEPPSAYGINRTTWKLYDLLAVLASKGTKISHGVLMEFFEERRL